MTAHVHPAASYRGLVTDPDHRARTRHAYDTVAADYAALLPGLDAESALDVAMIDDFAARCGHARLGPVADVGCGPGRVTAHLAARGVDVVGIDLSPGMIDVARRAHPGLRFEVGAMEALPLPDASLGGILAWYSLIHTAPTDLHRVVGEAARVLAADAYLLAAFQAGDGRRVDRVRAYGHAVPLTSYRHAPEHLGTVLDEEGFELRTSLLRSPEGRETSPQAVLLARRRH